MAGEPVSDSQVDDAALVARIVEGDASVLGALHDRHAPIMLAIGRRMLGQTSDAEDVLNIVFLRLWQKADQYDPKRASVRAYLLMTMRSRCLDHLRKRGPALANVEHAAASAEHPEQPVEAGERRAIVREAMASLSDEQRSAIEMAYYDGLTQQAIAEKTGTPLGTIKSRVRSGLIRLREQLRTRIGEWQ